ncbi:hypothetical protein BVC80_1817g1 [Macleaya cordata]|uniref:Uncharacterized protein n=1 Tax=Macleaya cordata TaxID=56857 RepID=A0A200QW16_MACCD|nr:hypothetical protein BVC80_1817g1 [Macleaya cordata]
MTQKACESAQRREIGSLYNTRGDFVRDGDDLTWTQVREAREPIEVGPRTRSRKQRSEYSLVDEREEDEETQEPLDMNMDDMIHEDDLVNEGGEDGIIGEDDERDDYL